MKSAIVQTATRRMRITVGDVLEGAEGTSVARIKITYIGRGYSDHLIIARRVQLESGEVPWTLSHRDWRRVR